MSSLPALAAAALAADVASLADMPHSKATLASDATSASVDDPYLVSATAAPQTAPIGAPGSLTGTGELAELSRLLLNQSPQLDEDTLRAQVNDQAASMNAREQPAKVTLNSATMPQNMTWDYLDALLRRLDPTGQSRAGFAIAFEAGVSWKDIVGAYVLHFRGCNYMPLKPDSNAGTRTRFASGQLIEPCMRVMQNSLDSAVDDGLLDASANIAVNLEVCPFRLL